MERTRWLHLALELLTALAVVVMLLRPVAADDYSRFATDTLRYERAQVTAVLAEDLTDSTLGTGQRLGTQSLRVRLADGQEIELTNYLTETHNVLLHEGDRAIVCADLPEGAAPYYTVYSYDRTGGLLALAALFVGLLALVGRRKGLDACLAIVFTLVFLLRVALPLLYNGGSPVGVGLMTVLLATAVTLVLLHGPTPACLLGLAATGLGEGAACVLFAVFSRALHLTGFQTDSAEGLLLIAQHTGLQIRTLLLAGVMIAALGAVMDVAVSILSALREVARASARPSRGELFRSGLRMGQDMIGTMSNTLIFAFAGGSLTTMLLFVSYGVQPNQLLNSDYLTIELAQGLCSTAAVILTVPCAAAIGALYHSRRARAA